MKKILILLFLFLLVPVVRAEEEDLAPNAKSAIMIEASTGEILFQKNKDEKLAPASMTKMMSMLLIMEEIENGNFREDLYFRLSVFQINLPPLRERKDDIESLSYMFLEKFANKLKKRITGITPEVLNILKKAEWKGNVRELRNVIERCSIVCEEQITFEDLPLDLQKRKSDVSPMKDSFELAEIERMHIIKVLQYTNGNKTETARLLKIGLATLYRKIEAYKISV